MHDDQKDEDGSAGDAVYGSYYYDSYSGGAYEFEGHWKNWFGSIADHIIRQFDPKTVLDAGCAKGFLVRCLRERGVEAYGIDASDYAIGAAGPETAPYVRVGSIAEPLDRHYDLITCVEVIEHLPPDQLATAVDVLSHGSDRVLLSSTPEGEHLGEPSHFAMRPPEDWAALFASSGFLRNLAVDVTWLTPWAAVYERRPGLRVADVVREYDRQLNRQVRESYELRRTAVKLEAELDGFHAGKLGQSAKSRIAELEAELEQRRRQAADAMTEVLRQRDIVIAAQRELGEAHGQIVSLTDQVKGTDVLHDRYRDAVDQYNAVVNSTTWRIAWKAMGPYRKLRGRVE